MHILFTRGGLNVHILFTRGGQNVHILFTRGGLNVHILFLAVISKWVIKSVNISSLSIFFYCGQGQHKKSWKMCYMVLS